MPKTPPPLVGFNNNVRHHGRIFHIQTEDSGVKRPHIITHLFGDGGRILKSLKTDYAEHVGQADTPGTVRRLMKEQHKAMFVALRSGELDPLIEQAFGPIEKSAPPAAEPVKAHEPMPPSSPEELASRAAPLLTPLPVEWRTAAAQAAAPQPEPAQAVAELVEREALPPPPPAAPDPLRRPTPPPVSTSIGSAVEAVAAKAAGLAPPRRSDTPPPLSAPSALQRRKSAENAGRYSLSRPASIFQEPESEGRSLFGDQLIGEKSLDEVILSYLAEDLDNPK